MSIMLVVRRKGNRKQGNSNPKGYAVRAGGSGTLKHKTFGDGTESRSPVIQEVSDYDVYA